MLEDKVTSESMRRNIPLQASAISGEMTGFLQSRGGKGLERQTERRQSLLGDASTSTCVPYLPDTHSHRFFPCS